MWRVRLGDNARHLWYYIIYVQAKLRLGFAIVKIFSALYERLDYLHAESPRMDFFWWNSIVISKTDQTSGAHFINMAQF